MTRMQFRILAVSVAAIAILAGCVKTVNDRSTAAFPIVKDKFEARYKRSVDQVYGASVFVMKYLGTISRESVINPGTNEVKAIEGKVNGRHVWVRVQAVDPEVTALTVQARTSAGGTDLSLTHEIDKQIAVKLTQPE
jgi:hypothetical protein